MNFFVKSVSSRPSLITTQRTPALASLLQNLQPMSKALNSSEVLMANIDFWSIITNLSLGDKSHLLAVAVELQITLCESNLLQVAYLRSTKHGCTSDA